jgi:hypothetical protein
MVTTPAMLSDLIARVATERVDLDVVAALSDRHALVPTLERLRPDLVVIGLRPTETDAVVHSLLERLPATRFVALPADGRSVFGYAFPSHRIALADASPQALIDFVRRAPEAEI